MVFRGVFDIDFLFIVEIWYDVHNSPGSTLRSISCQTFTVSPYRIDLVYLFPNLLHNDSKETHFLGIFFCDLGFFFVFTKNTCFLCAMFGNVTVLCLLSLKKTVQNPLWKSQVCPKFVNVIIENSQSHKSGANSTLYNVATRGFTLLPCIFIWTYPVCFAVTKQPSATSIHLYVPINEIVIKSEISGVMWQVAPESKIKLVSCELYPQLLPGLSELGYIHAIDAYIFCELILFVLFSDILFIFFDLYAQF